MRVITSFSKALYEAYAHRLLETWHNWPAEAKLVIYSEDMTGENSDRIEWKPLDFPDLKKFQMLAAAVNETAYGTGKPEPLDYRWDAGRFANKVWAMVEGSFNETGLCFWMDADCVTYRRLSADFLRRLIPPAYYLGSFQREGMYTETGFWGVRANHPRHKDFMHALKNVYLSGTIFKLDQWHDCMALDFTRVMMGDLIKSVNLSKSLNAPDGAKHPIALSQLGKYVDHCKGPRKDLGYSIENQWHRETILKSGRDALLGVRE